ncbi:PA0069 family radical SAM protein [Shimia sp. CNT1-13L.2]|uniref:PA0069 family radical SAM protein n=1 Tax=Shimia sp. CNT1-13L.2 TaxID=2959663 RepID=UPI0020CF1B80|nr:PA0069 family radical SAM protein [Shimia sp. CNT1-13L.2]MCP9482111.1 PA0069 family radical SAM protein [Shimia sp. CNT1-13L.2]
MERRHSQTIDPDRRRGRGAVSNHSGRFDLARVEENDGWEIAEERSGFRTELTLEAARSMITRNTSPDIPFDRSINPYRGCEHGCVYCFARPTHAYLGLSPGLEFETKLVGRPNAAEVLERELRRKNYRVDTLAVGTNTDPYQPVEREQGIWRACLKVLRDFKHPLGIVTKGTLIERDIDILSEMARDGLVHVGISVTTLDPQVARAIEPRVPSPARRLKTIEALSAAGIPVRAMMAPVVPSITDHEIEAVLAAGRAAGAEAASWIMLRLPREVSELFQEWLSEHFPDRAARVMARVREMHDGADYSSEWGKRMRGEGHYAQMIAARFDVALKRQGLHKHLPSLRRDLFCPPLAKGDQLALF